MEPPIKIDPEICHGTPCFNGTRVFADTLFDYLMDGYSIDEMLEEFPTVKREQVLMVLKLAKQDAIRHAAVVNAHEAATR
jgi:uncharacterized protein (DUF433 family)